MVWGERNRHHPIVCEVEKSEEHDEHIPEEFGQIPLQIDHGICDQCIQYGLHQAVRYLNENLQHPETAILTEDFLFHHPRFCSVVISLSHLCPTWFFKHFFSEQTWGQYIIENRSVSE